ncbi:MAG: hypothetical protein CEN90_567, partial [Parcubacteria group bacterium Licking1014_17]
MVYLKVKFLKLANFGERAKNGGVLGEEIFCPLADGFFCPPAARRRAGNSVSLDFVFYICELNSAE